MAGSRVHRTGRGNEWVEVFCVAGDTPLDRFGERVGMGIVEGVGYVGIEVLPQFEWALLKE